MELSVLIPTYQRPKAIEECLKRLAHSDTAVQFEVIVGLDGNPDITPEPQIPQKLRMNTRTIRPGRVGLLRLRQAMLEQARGRIVLWLNDDAYAQPGLLQAHLDAHAHSDTPRVVAGRAAWKPVPNPNLFDQVLQKTALVFFRQPVGGGIDPITPRNCFGLNMSFPLELARQVGGVADVSEHYGYEDIELAWRMAQEGAECVYQPNAIIEHDHRYTPSDVHRREYLLGRAAWTFANVNSDFMIDLIGIDLRDPAVINELRIAIEHAWRDALRIERSFLDLSSHEPDSIEPELLPLLADHWVLLKRLLWRWGVLDASRSIEPRWSLLRETSPEDIVNTAPDPV